MKKIFTKIWNFISFHPIWSMIVTWLIITFVEGYDTQEWNFLGCYFITLFLFALLSPFIRRTRAKKNRRDDMDYLAKRIAEEQNKQNNA